MTKYGVNTLFQSDEPGNTIPSGAGYNTPDRIEFAKNWIDGAADIGSQVIRYPGDWIGLEGDGKGQFSTAYVAETVAIIEYAASNGIEVIYEFGQTPAWARPNGVDEGNFTPPRNPQDFADAVAYLHEQFISASVADSVSSWEIWNEPNANLGWPTGTYRNPLNQNQGIDPSVNQAAAGEYVDLLNAAYDALKAVDPTVTVLGGSLAGTDFEYLGWMLDAGAKFDGLAVHPYTRNFDNADFVNTQSTAPARPGDDPTAFAEGQGLSATLNERFSFEYGLKELRKILDEDGRTDIDLYLTEMGWGVGAQGTLTVDSFETQAEYINEALEIVRDLGYVEAVTIFQLYDFTDGDVGLLDDNGNLRPGATALRDFIEANGDALPLDRTTTDTIARFAANRPADPEANNAADAAFDQDDGGNTTSIFGTPFNDQPIEGTNGNDRIFAGTGADFITATPGDDLVFGDAAGSQDYDQVNISGPGSTAANFDFSSNADGSVTVSSTQFGTDTWFGIDGVYFEEEGRWYSIDRLLNQETIDTAPADAQPAVDPGSERSGIEVRGTAGDDILAGTTGDDFVGARRGDDTILGDLGDDTIVGGGGSDRVIYEGSGSKRSDFVFTSNADGSITANSDAFGTDLLIGIEEIYFGEDDVFVEVDDLI